MKKKAANQKEASRWSDDHVQAYVKITQIIAKTWPRRPRNEGIDREIQMAWSGLAELTEDEWVAARQVLREEIRDRNFAPYLTTPKDILDSLNERTDADLVKYFKERVPAHTTDKPNDP